MSQYRAAFFVGSGISLCSGAPTVNGISEALLKGAWQPHIPTSVTNIGSSAFLACASLSGITLPPAVTSISVACFAGCSALTNFTIPTSVSNIGAEAFDGCSALTLLTIRSSVTNIGSWAFEDCASLSSICFTGNAPSVGSSAFDGDHATAYYLPGTTGWSQFLSAAGISGVVWNPQILSQGNYFGVRSNQFGFVVAGTVSLPIAIEACSNLSNSNWTILTSLTLTNGLYYFSDPQWTNYPTRFYGVGFP